MLQIISVYAGVRHIDTLHCVALDMPEVQTEHAPKQAPSNLRLTRQDVLPRACLGALWGQHGPS